MATQSLTDTLAETLSVFDATGDLGEPLTTAEVTEQVDVSRRSTYARLERLADRELLGTKKAGARGRVWWRPPATLRGDDPGTGEPNGAGGGPPTRSRAAESVAVAADTDDARAPSPPEEQFRALVDATEEYAVFMLDRDGHVATWNAGAERIEGYRTEEIVGVHVETFYTDADRAAGVPQDNLAAAADRGQIVDEGWRVRADGSTFWATVTISAVRDDDGDLRGFATVTRDMTDRRQYEQEVTTERDFARTVFETAPAGLFVVDRSGAVVDGNQYLWKTMGVDPGERSLSIGDFDVYDEDGAFVPPDDRPYRTIFETGEAVSDWRCQMDLPAGERRWLSIDVAPIEAGDGTVESAVVAATDVTRLREQARQLERERDDVASELEAVLTRVDDAFLAIDEDWVITFANEQAAELVALTVEDLLGARVWDVLYEIDDGRPRELAEQAMETQETAQFEYYSELLDAWFEVRVYPSENGQSVYFRDVTDHKARERRLERYETIVETVDDGIYAVDDDGRFVLVNEGMCELTGYERDELLGAPAKTIHDDEIAPRAEAEAEEIAAGERDVGTIEFDVVTESGERVPSESRFAPYRFGDEAGRCGVVRNMSERLERERELEESRRRYRTLIENFPNGAVALVDEDLRYQAVGGTPLTEAGATVEELEGSPLGTVLNPEVADVFVPRYEMAFDGEASAFEADFGEHIYQVRIVPVRDDDGSVFAAMGMSQDVTEHRRRERRLHEAKTQLEAAMEAGAVGAWEWHVHEDRMVAGASLARTFGLDPERVRDGIPIDEYLGRIHADDRDRVRRLVDEAVESCGEYRAEYRVRDGEGDLRWVVARGCVECDGDGQPVTFPGTLTDITERKQAELALERQHGRLRALNHLNVVVRDITDAVIEQSTRAEIEAVVCEALAASDSYSFAWTGEVDVHSGEVTPRVEAGVDGYLDDVSITVDPDDPRSEGPTGQALRTGEIQTTQDARADDGHEPWRDHVESYGIRSLAAIPLVHEGTVYGVLNVYADRPAAFEGEERAVIGQLGEIVGHAIAAVDRKQALMSDEVVELDFQITDVFDGLGIDSPTAGRLDLEEAVPIGDGDYLVYGHVSVDGRTVLEAIVDAIPQWQDPRLHDEAGATKFEVRLTEPPVLSTLAALGGSIESATIDDGDYQMTLHVPPGADVRRLIDAVCDAYPSAEMLSRRQVARTDDADGRLQCVVEEKLTDRQRAVLRAAYHADFFAWPRQTNGEDLADALGVSPPTFHQHLRKAEQTVFDAMLADDASADPSAD